MMAAILNSAMLDSDSAILDSYTLSSSLRFTQKHSHSTLMLIKTNSIWLKLNHSHLTSWRQPSWILPCWIRPSWRTNDWSFFVQMVGTNLGKCEWVWEEKLRWLNPRWSNSPWQKAILDSAILVYPLKLTHTCQDWFPPFVQKNFNYLFWFNLMMAAILNSAMLDSDTLLSSLRFTQKHSHSYLMLIQTNSIWLKLIHSHLTWWWQPSWIPLSWIWQSWIQPS